MEKTSKIYVAGHTGLVGSAITSTLLNKGYDNLVTRHMSELDLTNQKSVEEFFAAERPDYVILAAALVGGIVANNTYRADFIYQNIMIQSNVINAAWKNGVKKLLFLGSTCIYPKNAPQPLKEEYLLTSPLEQTNEPYAIAKIAGLKMCESFNRQYGTNFISVMPTNLYGPADNFNLERSHVLPALLRKIHLGKCLEEGDWASIRKDLGRNPVEDIGGDADKGAMLEILAKYGVKLSEGNREEVSVTVWGTGEPLREFMYSLDMAEACVFVMENIDVKDITALGEYDLRSDQYPSHFINIGTGEEITIRDLAFKIKDLTGFSGVIVFDTSKPDGTMRKATDATRLRRLGYQHKFDLNAGLAVLYDHYKS
jgi:GDP-L-fucose synthase